MRAKAKKAPMCSVSLIAIELKGLAAPGEALKNKNVFTSEVCGEKCATFLLYLNN